MAHPPSQELARRRSAPASADSRRGPGRRPPVGRTRGRPFGARPRAARGRWANFARQIDHYGADVPKVNLEHRALPKRMLHRSCLKSAIPLAEHDLLPFGMLQINELLLGTPVGNFEADDVRPESQADIQIGDVKLRDDVRPAGPWRSVPICPHTATLGSMAGEAQRIPPSFTTARQYAAEYAALFRPTGYD